MQNLLEHNGVVGLLGYDSGSMLILAGALCVIAAYLIGSINFAVLFSKLFYHEDVREYGSGNGGSTNMLRTYGIGMAFLTFFCDVLKAAVSTAIGLVVMPYYTGFAYVTAFVCMFGHAFPIYHRFKGGKSAACLAGAVLVLNPPLCVLMFILLVLIVAISRYMSLGSIVCALLMPVLNNFMPFWFTPVPPAGIVFALLMAVLVVALHHKNIKRLMEGTESKISFRKKKE